MQVQICVLGVNALFLHVLGLLKTGLILICGQQPVEDVDDKVTNLIIMGGLWLKLHYISLLLTAFPSPYASCPVLSFAIAGRMNAGPSCIMHAVQS